MRYDAKTVVAFCSVEVCGAPDSRGPIKRVEYWSKVLPWAVYERLVRRLRRELDDVEASLPAGWNAQFNSSPVGKRRKW